MTVTIHGLNYYFRALGHQVARRPIWFIVCPTIICGVLIIGLVLSEGDSSARRQFAPANNEADLEEAARSPYFQTSTRTFLSVIAYNEADDANLLTTPSLLELLRLYDKILEIEATVEATGETVRFDDVCARTTPQGPCAKASILNIYDFDADIITAVPDHVAFVAQSDPLIFYPPQFVAPITAERLEVGDFTYDDVKALNMILLCDDDINGTLEYEVAFRDAVIEWEETSEFDFHLVIRTERFLDVELQKSSGGDVRFFVITLTVMCVFSAIVMFNFDAVDNQAQLATLGVIGVALGIGASLGLGGFIGIPFVSLVAVMPFLILGVGIDDLFVLVGGFQRTDPRKSIEERTADMMEESGASVLTTTVTDGLAFIISISSVFRAVRWFSMYTGMAVLFVFMNQITFVTAWIVLDAHRQASNRHSFFPCWVVPADHWCRTRKTKVGTKAEGEDDNAEGEDGNDYEEEQFEEEEVVVEMDATTCERERSHARVFRGRGSGLAEYLSARAANNSHSSSNSKSKSNSRRSGSSSDAPSFSLSYSNIKSSVATSSEEQEQEEEELEDPVGLEEGKGKNKGSGGGTRSGLKVAAIREDYTGSDSNSESLDEAAEREEAEAAVRMGVVTRLIKNYYVPFLMNNVVRVIVLVVFFAVFGVALYGVTNTAQGLDVRDLAPDGSPIIDFFNIDEKYFPYGPTVEIILYSGVDVTDFATLDKLDVLFDDLSESAYVLREPPRLWTRYWHDWLVSEKNITSNADMPADIGGLLLEFLHNNPGHEGDVIVTGSGLHLASRGYVRSRLAPYVGNERGAQMTGIREMVYKVDLDLGTYSAAWPFFEQFLVIIPQTIQDFSIAFVCVIIVCGIFFQDALALLSVCGGIVMIDIDVIGYMYFWDIRLDSVSLICLLMAIGFSVETLAHIAHNFAHHSGVSARRGVEVALVNMGASVLAGNVSILLGVFSLAAASSQIFVTFFRLFLLIIVFAVTHGLIFMPVFLSVLPRCLITSSSSSAAHRKGGGHSKSGSLSDLTSSSSSSLSSSAAAAGRASRPTKRGVKKAW